MAKHQLLFDFINVIATAREIKRDEEKRQRSTRFGITSLVFSVISVAFAVGASLLLSLILEGNNDAIALFIFTIAGFAACLGGVLVCVIGSLVRVIAQLSINRKPIGWVALAVFIACMAAVAVIFIVL